MAVVEKRQTRSNEAKRFRARWADTVRQDPSVRGSTLEVALCLVFDFANHETLACFPHKKTIADALGFNSIRTVLRATQKLEALGYLEVRRRGRGRGHSNGYFFRFPGEEDRAGKGDNVVTLSRLEGAGKGDRRDTDTSERVTDQSQKGDNSVAPYIEPESNNLKDCADRAQEVSEKTRRRKTDADFPASAGFLPDDLLDRFTAAYPRTGKREAVEAALAEAVDAGADPAHLLAAARAYAVEQKGNPPRFIAYPENWLSQERWKQHKPAASPASEDAILANLAKIVIERKSYAASAISPTRARQLREAGLVSDAQLRAVGLVA